MATGPQLAPPTCNHTTAAAGGSLTTWPLVTIGEVATRLKQVLATPAMADTMEDTTAVMAIALVTPPLAAMTSLATHTTGVAITEVDCTAGTAVTEEATLALMAAIQAVVEPMHRLIRTREVIRTLVVTLPQGVAMAVTHTITATEPILTTVGAMGVNRTMEVDIITTALVMAHTTQVVVAKQFTPPTLLATTAPKATDTATAMGIHIIIKVAATATVTEDILLENTPVVARTRTIITVLITATTRTIIAIIIIQE